MGKSSVLPLNPLKGTLKQHLFLGQQRISPFLSPVYFSRRAAESQRIFHLFYPMFIYSATPQRRNEYLTVLPFRRSAVIADNPMGDSDHLPGERI
jgi:hypothetical protein